MRQVLRKLSTRTHTDRLWTFALLPMREVFVFTGTGKLKVSRISRIQASGAVVVRLLDLMWNLAVFRCVVVDVTINVLVEVRS